jgi:hypothetical protein
MNHKLQRIERAGIYHPMYLVEPHTAAQERWLDATCALVEGFAAHAELDFERRAIASLAIHLAADFLFLHLEQDASWSQLDPDALVARIAPELSHSLCEILAALAAFFSFLALSGRVERKRCLYVACYFEALASACERAERRSVEQGARRAAS